MALKKTLLTTLAAKSSTLRNNVVINQDAAVRYRESATAAESDAVIAARQADAVDKAYETLTEAGVTL